MDKIDFKNLPDQTTPLSAQNLNQLQTNVETAINGKISNTSGTSQSVGYSQEYMNKILGNASRITDMNTTLETGVYQYTNATANRPNLQAYVVLLVLNSFQGTTEYMTQIAISNSPNTTYPNKFAIRNYYTTSGGTNVFTDWYYPTEHSDIYSTSETIIGTWIDGKPLYRKVIDFGELPNNTTKAVNHNISNLGIVVTLKAIPKNISGNRLLVPHVSSQTAANGISMWITSNQVAIQTGTDRSGFSDYVIVEYTKTSD